jgi:hypothetical protein
MGQVLSAGQNLICRMNPEFRRQQWSADHQIGSNRQESPSGRIGVRRSGQTVPPPQKTLRDIVAVLHDNLWPLGGLAAQLVEQPRKFSGLVQGSSTSVDG